MLDGRSRPLSTTTLALFFLLLAVSATSNGVATPAWVSMIAKMVKQ
jgi:hypothetical protein